MKKQKRKFEVTYNPRFMHFECDTCGRKETSKGEKLILFNQSKTEMPTDIGFQKTIISNYGILKDKKSACQCGINCNGSLIFKGYKIRVTEITNRELTSIGGSFCFETGSKIIEEVFASDKYKLNTMAITLQKEYNEKYNR